MINNKPKMREAYLAARVDLKPEINKLRMETPRGWDEVWVVGVYDIDTVETRKLNRELGLNTNEGYSQWYRNDFVTKSDKI